MFCCQNFRSTSHIVNDINNTVEPESDVTMNNIKTAVNTDFLSISCPIGFSTFAAHQI